jgi:hypothetical protein
MTSVVLVQSESGDWEGLYVNGRLKAENHNLSARDVLRALEAPFKEVEMNDEWAERSGRLPATVTELQAAILKYSGRVWEP